MKKYKNIKCDEVVVNGKKVTCSTIKIDKDAFQTVLIIGDCEETEMYMSKNIKDAKQKHSEVLMSALTNLLK